MAKFRPDLSGCSAPCRVTSHRSVTWLLLVTVLLGTAGVRCQDPQSIEFGVLEEVANASVGIISQSDLIVNRYPQSTYSTFKYAKSINPNQDQTLFTLDRDTGAVRTARAVDREAYCAYQASCLLYLDVTITEPQEHIQVLTLRIQIIDENDNAPQFDQDSLGMQFSESAPTGTRRALYEARDQDSPQYGVAMDGYTLQASVQGLFEIERDEDGMYLVLRQNLDRETTDSYTLRLLAYDRGEPPKSSALDITITITDANDFPPVFSQEEDYSIVIAEDFPLNQTLVQIEATDKDIGINAEIVYSLGTLSQVSYGSVFGIHPTTGALFLKSSLDYERQARYELQVLAQDRGTDSQAATTTVQVAVTDINDNIPQVQINTLTENPSAEVPENQPEGTFVAFVVVSDSDGGENGQVTCDLNSDMFQLEPLENENQFKMTTRGELDRESHAAYTLEITCSDAGVPRLEGSGSVSVDVTDENDHSPEFSERVYTVTMSENSGVGAFIVQVLAEDEDIGDNSLITYALADPTQQDYVEIDPLTGTLRTATTFDYETWREITIPVTATDGGDPSRSDVATVELTITDVNDQAPQFDFSSYSLNLSESSSVGSLAGAVHASDSDSPAHAVFVYSLPQGGDAASFSVSAETGEITNNVNLDREAKAVYSFLAYATDLQDASLSTSTLVTVTVLDENDHRPEILYPTAGGNLTVEISNLVPIGYRILQISATDRDTGPNANLTYQLHDDTTPGQTPRLVINSTTGVITTNKDLSAVTYVQLDTNIIVRDQGMRPKSATTQVVIVIDSGLPLPGGVISVTPAPVQESNANMQIIIGLSVTTVVIVIVLVVAIALLRNGRISKLSKNSLAHVLERSAAARTSAVPPFTPVADSGGKDSGLIPIAIPSSGQYDCSNPAGLDDSGSDDTVHSNDSGRGPSEGDTETHVGVKRIDSARQRPISIITSGQAFQPYQPPGGPTQHPPPSQDHSPESHNSSGHYQPIEPFQQSSPRKHDFSPPPSASSHTPHTPTRHTAHFQFPPPTPTSDFPPPSTPSRHQEVQFPRSPSRGQADFQFVSVSQPSSPTKAREFNYDTDYVEPNMDEYAPMHFPPALHQHHVNNHVNHHQQHRGNHGNVNRRNSDVIPMELLQRQHSMPATSSPHFHSNQQQHPQMYHQNGGFDNQNAGYAPSNRQSGGAIEQWKSHMDDFSQNNPQTHINHMIGRESTSAPSNGGGHFVNNHHHTHEPAWSNPHPDHSHQHPDHSHQHPDHSHQHRPSELPRQMSAPPVPTHYPPPRPPTQYLHMNSVPQGGLSMDV